VLPDNVVKQKKGGNVPIMNLHERVLSVLSCRYVDEVIIGAPWEVTDNLITSSKINIVVQGKTTDPAYLNDDSDPYEVPKRLGIYKEIDSQSDITTSTILERIIANRNSYVQRNLKKEKKEIDVIKNTNVDDKK